MRRFLRFHAASAVSSTYSTEGGRTIGRFHIRIAHKRRGGILPARLRFSAHRGVTLIELMISMLILTLVCVAWLEIIGIQSAKKEARRREAVERLAGMMDAFMYYYRDKSKLDVGDYRMKSSSGNWIDFEYLGKAADSVVHPVFDTEVSPIGYRLRVVNKSDASGFIDKVSFEKEAGWGSGKSWLVGRLYNECGTSDDVRNRNFFSLPICLWF